MSQQIAVTLSSSTVYVSGLVNGVAYSFSLTDTSNEGTIWSTTVARSVNDIYEVEITAIDGMGNSTTVSTVLYYGLLNLITDRTQFDVNRYAELKAKGWQNMTEDEKSEWLLPLKGCYNYTDMNRVESAVEHLSNRLKEIGYPAPSLSVKKDWKRTDIPKIQDMERYYSNVATLRQVITLWPTTPNTPTVREKLNYRKANDLEQILVDIGLAVDGITNAWHYSGELYAGEV